MGRREEKGLNDVLKNIANGIWENVHNAKEDLGKPLKEELRRYLSKIDTHKAIEHIAQNYDVEVKARFSLKKKKGPKTDEGEKKTDFRSSP